MQLQVGPEMTLPQEPQSISNPDLQNQASISAACGDAGLFLAPVSSTLLDHQQTENMVSVIDTGVPPTSNSTTKGAGGGASNGNEVVVNATKKTEDTSLTTTQIDQREPPPLAAKNGLHRTSLSTTTPPGPPVNKISNGGDCDNITVLREPFAHQSLVTTKGQGTDRESGPNLKRKPAAAAFRTSQTPPPDGKVRRKSTGCCQTSSNPSPLKNSSSESPILLQQVRVQLEKIPPDCVPSMCQRRLLQTGSEAMSRKTAAANSKKQVNNNTIGSSETDLMMLPHHGSQHHHQPVANAGGAGGRVGETLKRLSECSDSVSVVSSLTTSSTSSSACSKETFGHLFEIPRPRASHKLRGSPSRSSVSTVSSSIKSAKGGSGSGSVGTVLMCKWELCGQEFESSGKLLEHLKNVHASCRDEPAQSTETKQQSYKCLWEGCKVYGRGSSSRSWLEKHVLTNHGDNKPFQCIVDGCTERFGTQMLLERHVNAHFKPATPASENNRGGGKSGDTSGSPVKNSVRNSIRKIVLSNGQKVRVRPKLRGSPSQRRPPTSISAFDVFDLGVMDKVRQRLTSMESSLEVLRSGGFVDTKPPSPDVSPTTPPPSTLATTSSPLVGSSCDGNTVEAPSAESTAISPLPPPRRSSPSKGGAAGDQIFVFKSRVTAKKTDASTGQVSLLLSWVPDGILEPEWCLASQATPERRFKMTELPVASRIRLTSKLSNRIKSSEIAEGPPPSNSSNIT